MASVGRCKRCNKISWIQTKGLCRKCLPFYEPPIEDEPAETDLPLDDNPTDALPGTNKKIKVMKDRAARKRAIFHPKDKRLE